MGRPRKNFIKEEVKPKRQYTKKVNTEQESSKSVEVLEQQVEQLTELATAAIAGQIEARQIANEAEEKAIRAEDKFRELAKETERCLNMIAYHCKQVQENTGSLIAEDVEYSISLAKRFIENKFKKA
jgi:uracil-DNA glycosylase